jgi:hypothetical protein
MNNNNIEDEINSIKNTIDFLNKFVKTEKVQELKKENFNEYKTYLILIFPTFYDLYPTLFNNIIEEKELTFLDEMFEGIIKINNNNSLKDNIEKNLGEKLAEKFLYPYVKKK